MADRKISAVPLDATVPVSAEFHCLDPDQANDVDKNRRVPRSAVALLAPVQSVNSQTGAVNLDKSSIGLPQVDNTSDANKPVSTAQSNALTLKEDVVNKGVANGYAELDGSGFVPSGQLPSFVDDMLPFANLAAFPGTGEDGKIYVTEDTNLTYRWSGSAYVEISASLALGETLSTAYRGDRGKIAYDYSQAAPAAITAQITAAIAAANVGDGIRSTTGAIIVNDTWPITANVLNPDGTQQSITYNDGGAGTTITWAYDANDNIDSITVTDGTDTWVNDITYTADGSSYTDTGFVQQ